MAVPLGESRPFEILTLDVDSITLQYILENVSKVDVSLSPSIETL